MTSRFSPTQILCAIALACAASAASAQTPTAPGQPMQPTMKAPAPFQALSTPVYNGARDDLKASYKAARDACNKLAGNAKDVCVERAKGDEKVGMANLKYQHTGAMKDRNDFLEARNDARYKIAKESCDDMAGNPKDVCRADAKAQHDKAKADMKANKAVNEARSDAVETKMKANYKTASERCDGMAGNDKDVCVASAKARYHQ